MPGLTEWLLGLDRQRRLNSRFEGLLIELKGMVIKMADQTQRFDADLDALATLLQGFEDEITRLKAVLPPDVSGQLSRLEQMTAAAQAALNPQPDPAPSPSPTPDPTPDPTPSPSGGP